MSREGVAEVGRAARLRTVAAGPAPQHTGFTGCRSVGVGGGFSRIGGIPVFHPLIDIARGIAQPKGFAPDMLPTGKVLPPEGAALEDGVSVKSDRIDRDSIDRKRLLD